MNHVMETTAVGPEGFTIECPDCGKVRVIYRQQGRPPATLTRGDDDALHAWASSPGVSVAGGIP